MKKVLKVIGIFLSLILTIPIFALELLLIINIILNNFISTDNLNEILEELITYNNKNRSTLITLASPNTYGNYITYNDKIDYSFVEKKIKEYLMSNGFTLGEAQELLQDEEVKRIVNNYIESIVLNKIKDSEIIYPTKEEVKSFIKKNYSVLKRTKLIEEKYNLENIDELVEESYEEVKMALEKVQSEVEIPEVKELEFIKMIININPFIILLCILILIGILMILRMSFYKWLAWVSIPTLANGIFLSAFGLFGMRLITTLVDLNDYTDIIDPIAKKMSTMMIKYGIILIIITIFMIIIYSVVKNSKKTKK